ncbi:MAG: nuclear transport factor 2 family protein [Myxococcota bacterium]|nr:nuclear transport factor 2 family protein [Myxococcota bacterium]
MNPIPLLLIDRDLELRELLTELLASEGYSVDGAASLQEALPLLHSRPFALVLTDVKHTPENPIAHLVSACAPAPLGLLSSWGVDPPLGLAQGARFVLTKPFEIETLLEAVGKYGHPLPVPEHTRWLIEQYFSALATQDWKTLGELCSEEVVYNLPGDDPVFSLRVEGRERLCEYAASIFSQFQEARFEVLSMTALPQGTIARYEGSWKTPSGRARLPGAVRFSVADGQIHEVGVRLELATLLQKTLAAPATTS